MKKNKLIFITILPFILTILASNALAEIDGKSTYMKHCAACHGIDGKGTDKLSSKSSQKPSDLTILSKSNNDHFPYIRLRQIIDGRVAKGNIRAHYNNDMPIWGTYFSTEAGGQINGDAVAKMRILNIVDYLVTIQGK